MSNSAIQEQEREAPPVKVPTAEEAAKDLSVYVPETVRKPGEIVFACMGVLLGVLGWYFAMDMGGDTYSSPSVFPKIASTVIILCGSSTLLKALKKSPPPADSESAFSYLLPKDVLVMLLMLIAYCVILPHLHFIPSSYLFMVAGMIYLQHGKNIVRSLIYSAIALLVLVIIFRYLFLVILP